MQRTLSLAAAKSSSSTSPLSLRPLMAKLQLQCRAIQSLPASSSSSVVSVYRNVCQLHFQRENASCFKLACALPSIGSVSYTAHFSCSSLSSFGNSFRLFPGRYFSQVPNTGNKDKVVKKFSKNWNNKNKKKNEVLASSEAEVVTATEPVIGDVSSGVKMDLAAAPSPASNGTVKPKRRPKKKKVEDKDKSSSTVSALEEVSVEESLKTVPKTKHSGSGNRKSSSAKEVAKDPKGSAPTEASNAPKQEKVLASSELSTEASPASNGKQASNVKPKRRPKKKVDDKSSSAVPVLEAISVEESSKSAPKPKDSGSGNRKSSSAKLAQKLYEGVQLSDGQSTGLITYMRTDGLHIGDEAIKDIQSLVVERFGNNFTSDGPRKYYKKVKNAQEAHEAIRPTNIRRLPSTIASLLDADSLKLYTLIWARAMACQMEPASVVQIQIDIGNAAESIIFRSSCSKVEFLGYQAIYEDPEAKAIRTKDDEKCRERDETFETLSLLKDGDLLNICEVELKQHHTQHPPRYSEGSLIKKLEELGIGRPSTYASIFKVLQDRKYLTIKSRVLYPEFRGRMVSAFLTNYFTEVTDYSFTADMETELDNVSGGVTEWKGLLRDYWTRFSAYCKRVENVQIQQVEKMLEKRYEDFLFSSLPDPTRTCPSCSEGTLVFKVSKFGSGYFIGCDGYPSCKFVAKTLYGEDEDEDETPKNTCVEEPKLLGVHPNTNEKVILKCGPYGHYVQLGEDKKGHVPQRANASHIKDVNSITLEGALELLRYPLTLGNHPEDGQPVFLKLSKSGFTVRHRRTMATVPKNVEPSDVTFEKAMKLLSGKNVRLCGRPKRVKPTVVDEEEEGDEEAAEAMLSLIHKVKPLC
ncbi:hypothetical protein F2Q68_00029128 [Brassica cretica]|uniref:Topo IA-type catalytic domain-containing protein n=1 Tax=Brassica cretica TaxID=69181 RepID=A0A8S9G9K2_BRACR|nr:hypothetical protein F2Q68_00029128 [Brassica cretica]